VKVTLVNKTAAKVTFGLWSAPNDHEVTKKVASADSVGITLDHPDSRVVGVWTDSNHLYPSNKTPLIAGGYFADNGTYTVSLTPQQISISTP
jgi:hypothetical protein